MSRCLVALTLAILAAPLPAQDAATPDFSGTWILNLAKSKLGEQPTIGSETIVITCSGTTIQFDTTIDEKKQQPWIYTTDGKEHLFEEVPGGDEVAKATWEKSVLVIRSIGRTTLLLFTSPTAGRYPPMVAL